MAIQLYTFISAPFRWLDFIVQKGRRGETPWTDTTQADGKTWCYEVSGRNANNIRSEI